MWSVLVTQQRHVADFTGIVKQRLLCSVKQMSITKYRSFVSSTGHSKLLHLHIFVENVNQSNERRKAIHNEGKGKKSDNVFLHLFLLIHVC